MGIISWYRWVITRDDFRTSNTFDWLLHPPVLQLYKINVLFSSSTHNLTSDKKEWCYIRICHELFFKKIFSYNVHWQENNQCIHFREWIHFRESPSSSTCTLIMISLYISIDMYNVYINIVTVSTGKMLISSFSVYVSGLALYRGGSHSS